MHWHTAISLAFGAFFLFLKLAIAEPVPSTLKFVQPNNGLIVAGSVVHAVVVTNTHSRAITINLIGLDGSYYQSQQAAALPTKSTNYYFYADFQLPLTASGAFQLNAVFVSVPSSLITMPLTVIQNQIPTFCLPEMPRRCRGCRYFEAGPEDEYAVQFDYGNVVVEDN